MIVCIMIKVYSMGNIMGSEDIMSDRIINKDDNSKKVEKSDKEETNQSDNGLKYAFKRRAEIFRDMCDDYPA